MPEPITIILDNNTINKTEKFYSLKIQLTVTTTLAKHKCLKVKGIEKLSMTKMEIIEKVEKIKRIDYFCTSKLQAWRSSS